MDPGDSPHEATFRYTEISKLYDAFENCNWTIVVPRGNYIHVQLDWVSLSDEDRHCKDGVTDTLEIYDGVNDGACLLSQICGNNEVDDIYSTGNIISLQFQRGQMHRGLCNQCKPTEIRITGKLQDEIGILFSTTLITNSRVKLFLH